LSRPVPELAAEIAAGRVILVDLSAPPRFAQNHPAGALNLPFGPALVQAAATLPADVPLVVFADQPAVAEQAARLLTQAGREVAEVFGQGADAWAAAGGRVEGVPRMTVDELAARVAHGGGDLTVLDVREPSEWRSGVIPGAVLMPLGSVPERSAELDPERPVAVVCAHGNRSATAAAWLGAHGFAHVHNVPGGMALWLGAGHPAVPPPA